MRIEIENIFTRKRTSVELKEGKRYIIHGDRRLNEPSLDDVALQIPDDTITRDHGVLVVTDKLIYTPQFGTSYRRQPFAELEPEETVELAPGQSVGLGARYNLKRL